MPIDTNLETWLTSLFYSVSDLNFLTVEKKSRLTNWYLKQQLKVKHPFTHADAGGWQWTSLSGGVPDADDTAGALLALKSLQTENSLDVKQSVQKGLGWLLGLQNKDGGVPTFCKGWGRLPFDQSCPDITAHAIKAATVWLKGDIVGSESFKKKLELFVSKGSLYLENTQNADGSWFPLWFGDESRVDQKNPIYGTAKVVSFVCSSVSFKRSAIDKGISFLIEHQKESGGWGAGLGSWEETALSLEALAEYYQAFKANDQTLFDSIISGIGFLHKLVKEKNQKAEPIGLYFASLWYYEKTYPAIFAHRAVAAITGAFKLAF